MYAINTNEFVNVDYMAPFVSSDTASDLVTLVRKARGTGDLI